MTNEAQQTPPRFVSRGAYNCNENERSPRGANREGLNAQISGFAGLTNNRATHDSKPIGGHANLTEKRGRPRLERDRFPDSSSRRGKGISGRAIDNGSMNYTDRGAHGPADDGHTMRDSLTDVVGPVARANSVLPRSAPGASTNPPQSRDRYLRYMNSDKWGARRDRYFTTHGRRCAFCGSTRSIELHHHTYVRLGAELDDDLVPLCHSHHEEVHAYHRSHDVGLTEATRAVAARFDVTIVRRRPRRGEPTKKDREKARKQRKRERTAAQRAEARSMR